MKRSRIGVSEQNPWVRRIKRVAVVYVLLYLGFLADYNVYRFFDLRQEVRETEARVEALKQENAQFLVQIDRLRNDLAYIERVAREKFRLRRPEETVFIIKERATP